MNDSSLTHQSLYWGAQKFANSAMEAHANSDLEVFILHAGVSIERLAKASLSKTTPLLLLDTKPNEENILHFAGIQEAKRVRTVGAVGAIARLRAMNALPADSGLDELIELRNGVAHLQHSGGAIEDTLNTFVTTTNNLLEFLNLGDLQNYWGKWLNVVEITMRQDLESTQKDVARRIENSRHLIDGRFRELSPSAMDAVYADAGSGRMDGYGYGLGMMCGTYSYSSPYICPACNCRGTLSVVIPGLGATPEGPHRRSFGCPLCGIALRGDDELSAANIPTDALFFDEEGRGIKLTVSSFTSLIELEFLTADEASRALRQFD
ncbi:hypothetical protein [Streptomyces sp. NPDC090093]|uniref:hypothetical protein n=1 Tax=Streptomyces sp. NPDC090093 TaxID=3365945 RepID=UPI00381EE60A